MVLGSFKGPSGRRDMIIWGKACSHSSPASSPLILSTHFPSIKPEENTDFHSSLLEKPSRAQTRVLVSVMSQWCNISTPLGLGRFG
jgi:hypothetical protein